MHEILPVLKDLAPKGAPYYIQQLNSGPNSPEMMAFIQSVFGNNESGKIRSTKTEIRLEIRINL